MTVVPDDEFKACSSNDRDLWIHVTRVKNSSVVNTTESFLSATPRQLPVLNNNMQLVFASIQGVETNARILGAISFALFAVLSVFAF